MISFRISTTLIGFDKFFSYLIFYSEATRNASYITFLSSSSPPFCLEFKLFKPRLEGSKFEFAYFMKNFKFYCKPEHLLYEFKNTKAVFWPINLIKITL